jgi:hypothetical protein
MPKQEDNVSVPFIISMFEQGTKPKRLEGN